MPLTAKGKEIMSNMVREYGAKKGKQVFYASANKGRITGVEESVDYILSDHFTIEQALACLVEGTKGPYPFGDKENQYKKYSDSSLSFAAKDAVAAKEALGGDNPDSNWYADDSSTIYSEMLRRKNMRAKGGKCRPCRSTGKRRDGSDCLDCHFIRKQGQ